MAIQDILDEKLFVPLMGDGERREFGTTFAVCYGSAIDPADSVSLFKVKNTKINM